MLVLVKQLDMMVYATQDFKINSWRTGSFTKIFNTSIEQGTWLSDWKRGEWVPVYTKNNREEVKNYRPITTLLFIYFYLFYYFATHDELQAE